MTSQSLNAGIGELAAFGRECAEWLATQGAIPLSAHALYTGNGPEDETFGDKARSLLGRACVARVFCADCHHGEGDHEGGRCHARVRLSVMESGICPCDAFRVGA